MQCLVVSRGHYSSRQKLWHSWAWLFASGSRGLVAAYVEALSILMVAVQFTSIEWREEKMDLKELFFFVSVYEQEEGKIWYISTSIEIGSPKLLK